MDVHGSFDMLGNRLKQVSLVEEDFPATPTVGRFVFKNQTLYICVDISGAPVWVPLTQNLQMKRFVQSTPGTEWVIVHGLNTANVIVQAYDNTGKWIIPDEINTGTFNQVTLTFNTPVAGTVVVMRGNEEGNVPPLIHYTQSFTNSTTWVITHNLGYNPIINLYINNELVQPLSLTFDSPNQATAVFSSPQTGEARCI